MDSHTGIESLIKTEAQRLGFDACGFAEAQPVERDAVDAYHDWISNGGHSCMTWAERYDDIRHDPHLLLPGARSVICLAMNYYPDRLQPADAPQFALYAYGRDYHEVLRNRAGRLAQFIHDKTGCLSRVCVDSAPMRERYWAQRSGIGFVGLNGMVILPGKGSFFVLCELVTELVLTPDHPCVLTCGECHACERNCPGQALHSGVVDTRKCLSCQTIENRDPQLPQYIVERIGNRVYGCDECQRCCPHNRHATPTRIPEFQPRDEFLALDAQAILNMTQEQFSRIFSHSAVKRAKLAGLQRNIRAIKGQVK